MHIKKYTRRCLPNRETVPPASVAPAESLQPSSCTVRHGTHWIVGWTVSHEKRGTRLPTSSIQHWCPIRIPVSVHTLGRRYLCYQDFYVAFERRLNWCDEWLWHILNDWPSPDRTNQGLSDVQVLHLRVTHDHPLWEEMAQASQTLRRLKWRFHEYSIRFDSKIKANVKCYWNPGFLPWY